jgi:aryl-alcohol dehydrogenase-like predicted oxidoreductase
VLASTLRDLEEHGFGSRIALAWLLERPGVTAPILGARTAAQLEDNLGALDLVLDTALIQRLDDASAVAPIFPGRFLRRPMLQQLIFGSAPVSR